MKARRILSLFIGMVSAATAGVTVDVAQFGARGDGKTDDTAALQAAINAAPEGSTITFGGTSQTYLISSRLVLLPGRTYSGQGTIKMSPGAPAHTAIAKFSYGAATQATITGITLDASGIGGGLQFAVDGGDGIPADSIVIDHVTIRNTTNSPAGPWDGAIYDPVGLTNSQITYNQIIACGLGMYLANLNTVSINHNNFQLIRYGDAVSVTFNAAGFTYGQGIEISQNTGQHLGRMAIELWPTGGNVGQSSQIQGVSIVGNTFTDWDNGVTDVPFGISMMAGSGAVIQNNKLAGGTGGFGIELGGANSTVSQNMVQGFSSGVVLHDTPGSTVSGNLLTGQGMDGIEFSNAPGSRENVTISDNSIVNAQVFGIYVNTSSWGGSTLKQNFISRVGGTYDNDSQQGSFTGIAITPPNTPVNVIANQITQAGTNGPGNFGFIGIRLNGGAGANASSAYRQNSILSYMALAQSFGLYINSPGSADSAYVEGNSFTGLNSVTGGATSSGALVNGNLAYNCMSAGPVSLVQ